MIIYIAELSHTGVERSPNVVPIVAGYLAATAKKYFPDIDIRIFRDPNKLLRTTELIKPDIMGFSTHLWSERVSTSCAQKVKENSKSTVIVAGGQSVDDIDLELSRFLRLHTYYDVCIPNEGEIAFLRLIEHVRTHGRLIQNEIIEGCASLASDGSLLRGSYMMPTLSDIPSPYLGGFIDAFLHEG